MPEHAELRINADFINDKAKGKVFTKLWHVHKGNNPEDSAIIENFNIIIIKKTHQLIDFEVKFTFFDDFINSFFSNNFLLNFPF